MPDNLDLSLVDEIEQVNNEEAIQYARRLARKKAFLQVFLRRGGSCCSTLCEATENAGKTIVVILPDSAERYLSSILFEGMFDEQGLTTL